jgi:hypothetical protein
MVEEECHVWCLTGASGKSSYATVLHFSMLCNTGSQLCGTVGLASSLWAQLLSQGYRFLEVSTCR